MKQERRKKIPVPEELRQAARKDSEAIRASELYGMSLVSERLQGRYGTVWRKNRTEFFMSVMNWFETVLFLQRDYVTMLLKEEKPISSMWLCYNQNPVLNCETSGEIEEILEDMMFYRKICLAS